MTTMPFKKLPLAALAALAATAAVAAPAQAAPDWTPAHDLTDPDGTAVWSFPQVGYTDDGLELGAHVEGRAPNETWGKLVLTSRRAGGSLKTELVIDPTDADALTNFAFDVAPSGAAVVSWQETDGASFLGPQTFRAAYRTPGGSWEQPVRIAIDTKLSGAAFPTVAAAIGDDGTAVAGASHLEAGPDAEFQADGRTDVRVHPAGGEWDAAKRLSTEERGASELQLGVDADGRATAAYVERSNEGSVKGTIDDISTVLVRVYSPSNGLWGGADDEGLTGISSRATHLRLDVSANGRAALAFAASGGGTRFALAARRPLAAARFDEPDAVGKGNDNLPLAVGVAPDDATYALVVDNTANTAAVTRVASEGTATGPVEVGAAGQFSLGDIAFRGNDAFVAWDGFVAGDHVPQASTWRAGAASPDARRTLDDGHSIRSIEELVSDRDGSVVAVWSTFEPAARFAAFDGTAPRTVDAAVPTSGVAGAELAMSARFADAFSPTAEPQWDFGDGVTGSGAAVSHAYAAAGSYTVTVRSRDTFGNEREETFPVSIAARPEQAPAEQQPAPSAQQPPTAAAPTAPADRLAPTAKITLPAKKIRGRRSAWRTIRGTLDDAAPSSGIARVEVSATKAGSRKVTFRTGTVKGGKWTRKAPKLTRGTWTFRVRVTDKAGNVSKVAARKVKLR